MHTTITLPRVAGRHFETQPSAHTSTHVSSSGPALMLAACSSTSTTPTSNAAEGMISMLQQGCSQALSWIWQQWLARHYAHV
jgi:hypothetical protein